VKSNEPPEFKPTNWYDLPLEVGMDPAGSLCTPPHDAASQDQDVMMMIAATASSTYGFNKAIRTEHNKTLAPT
jgi:hypothetical protein